MEPSVAIIHNAFNGWSKFAFISIVICFETPEIDAGRGELYTEREGIDFGDSEDHLLFVSETNMQIMRRVVHFLRVYF